jgi:hypothetical protein
MQPRQFLPLPMPVQGVHRELSQVDMPPEVLHDAENWIYRDGRLRVRDGFIKIGSTLTGRPVGFATWSDYATIGSPVSVLVAATTSKYYLWDQASQDWTDLAGTLTGDETTHNIFRIFQKGTGATVATTMYACNGINENKKYVYGDANVSTMGADIPIAKAMMVLADRMILGNLVDHGAYGGACGPQVIAVSNSQDPTTGYGTVLIDQLADTPGAIVAMMEMGNLQGAIYKEDAIYLVTAASDVVPFTFALKAVVPGPVSPRAVVRVNDGLHIYLATNGDVMKFDGVSAVPLGRHLQRFILDNWNSLMSVRANGWYDHENNEVCIAFPDFAGDCSKALLIRITDSPPTLWPYDFGIMRMTAGIRTLQPGGVRYFDMEGVAPIVVAPTDLIGDLVLPLSGYESPGTALIVGNSDGTILRHAGSTDNGSAISAFYDTGLVSFGSPHKWKSVQFFDLVFSPPGAAQSVTMDLFGTDFGEAADTPLSSASADINSMGQHRTYHRCAARRLAYRLSVDATNPVELNAGHLAYVEQGNR